MESMRHSSFVAEPSGVPSSNQPRRYQSPSQASLSRAVASARMCARHFAARVRVAARFGEVRERVERGVQQPAEPDALALAAFADPVHAVVPVAAADQRQPVGADRQAGVQGPGAMLVEAGGLVRDGRLEEALALAGLQRLAVRNGTASSSTAASPVTLT